jgi:hypothetical protein
MQDYLFSLKKIMLYKFEMMHNFDPTMLDVSTQKRR